MSRLNVIGRALALLLVALPITFEMIDRVFGEIAFFASASLSTSIAVSVGLAWICFCILFDLLYADTAHKKIRGRTWEERTFDLIRGETAQEWKYLTELVRFKQMSLLDQIEGLGDLNSLEIQLSDSSKETVKKECVSYYCDLLDAIRTHDEKILSGELSGDFLSPKVVLKSLSISLCRAESGDMTDSEYASLCAPLESVKDLDMDAIIDGTLPWTDVTSDEERAEFKKNFSLLREAVSKRAA